jgi:hypothetical protein
MPCRKTDYRMNEWKNELTIVDGIYKGKSSLRVIH